MMQQSETDIIEQIRSGNQRAFKSIVEQYQDMVYTVCLRMLGNVADAEEAAQEVFVKVYRAISSFEGKSKFSTWIYRVAYNQCISILRSKVKMFDLVDELPDTEVNEADLNGLDTLSREERSAYLKQAIEALPETDAVVITLFYYDELSLEEIADITGLSNNNIRIKLHRSRKKLYQVLTKELKTEITSIL